MGRRPSSWTSTSSKRRSGGASARRPPLVPDFRPLDADGCAAAFVHPERVSVEGRTIAGAEDQVHLLVASVADFLVMKAHALAGRDKPKDAYDLCFCLDHAPGGIESLARAWRDRRQDALVAAAIGHLKDKFATVVSYGPQQVAVSYEAQTRDAREVHARRAFELVTRFLDLVG
jgi:nucleotidyltransferase AbiEii toxin of type IV toxin-antitoxin system